MPQPPSTTSTPAPSRDDDVTMPVAQRTATRSWPRPPREVAPGRLWAGLGAMLLVAGALLAVLVRVALHSSVGGRADRRMMESVGSSARAAVRITDGLTYITVAGVGLCLATCVVIALLRGRYSLALGALVLIAGANVTTQLLKYQLFHREDGLRNHLPSGHTTVAVSVGLAAVLVAPSAWRWFVVPLAGFVGTFVGAGTVVGQWHMPSDVVAAVAVCLGWTAVALAVSALLQRDGGRAGQGWAVRSWLALPGGALVGLFFVIWGVRPGEGDVNLALASVALVSIGVAVTAAVMWTASLAERYLH